MPRPETILGVIVFTCLLLLLDESHESMLRLGRASSLAPSSLLLKFDVQGFCCRMGKQEQCAKLFAQPRSPLCCQGSVRLGKGRHGLSWARVGSCGFLLNRSPSFRREKQNGSLKGRSTYELGQFCRCFENSASLL